MMPPESSYLYIDVLNFRVKHYLQRIRDEKAWKNHIHKASLSSSQPQQFHENPKQIKKPESVPYQATRLNKNLRRSKFEQEKMISKLDSDNHNLLPANKNNVNNKKLKYRIETGAVSKELVITPGSDHKIKLLKKHFNETQLCHSTTKIKFPLDTNRTSYRTNTDEKSRFKYTCNLPTQEDNFPKREIEKPKCMTSVPHQFESSPTIIFLEDFVWKELLNDTCQELEKIFIKNETRRNEKFLIAVRHYIQSLQLEKPPYEVGNKSQTENSHVPCSEQTSDPKEACTQSDEKTLTVQSKKNFGNAIPDTKHKKTKAAVLKLDSENVRSILQGQYAFNIYAEKVWPVVSHNQDFPSLSIRVSDDILDDALREVVQEFDTISEHIVQSCFKQEMGEAASF